MRILQLGDTHLGITSGHLGATQGRNRAAEHLAALDAALEPIWRGEIDILVHTGDLFDRSRPPQRAVIDAADRLVRAARLIPTLVIAGNHDRQGLLRYIPHRLPNLVVADSPCRVRLAGLRIAALPFTREPADWARRAAVLCEGGVDFLVAHQAFEGDQVPGFRFRVGRPHDTLGAQHIPPGLRWILSGHLHPRQSVQLGQCTVVHAGSTERTSISEVGQPKGTVLWDWGDPVCWRYVDGPTRSIARVQPELTG